MNINKMKSYHGNTFFNRVVVFPVIAVLVYLYFFMPDRYESSTLVSVKDTGTSQVQSGILASLGVNAQSPSDDKNMLRAYIGSKSFAKELDEELSLKAHYAKSWDFIFGINESTSLEAYYKFFKKHIRVTEDVDTGLLAIYVQAYTASFSKNLTDTILQKSEKFINDTGRKVAESEMSFALDEIERNQKKLKLAKSALLNFQNEHNLVSPNSEGESLLTIIYELEGVLAKSEAELSQQQTILNRNAPQIKALESRIEALKKEIDVQKRRIIGGQVEQGKLNELASQYQNLLLDMELATTLYSSSLSAYELARVQAGKQLKYLVTASSPQLAEDALYPRRTYWLVTNASLLCLVYLIARLVYSVADEHSD